MLERLKELFRKPREVHISPQGLKFCCSSFYVKHQMAPGAKYKEPDLVRYEKMWPHIRIVKASDKLLEKDYISRFYYQLVPTDDDDYFIVLAYCPFCGVSLYKFYTEDIYATAMFNEKFRLVPLEE